MKHLETHSCSSPLALAELVAYRLGELDSSRETQLEEQYFACSACAERLRWTEQLEGAITHLVRHGGLRAAVTEDFVRDAKAAGVTLREYSIQPGGSVQCTITPDDDLVVVRLGVGELSARMVAVSSSMKDLDQGLEGTSVTEDAVVDQSSKSILYAFPGDVVRTFPKSRWVMTVESRDESAPASLGPYTMNHTPFEG
jgi:hypothetical protein